MSVSGVSSSSSYQTSLLSLLGESDSSSNSGTLTTSSSSVSSLLGQSSSSGSGVTVDLSNYAQAAASGDTTGKANALTQLKTDLASQQASLESTLFGASSDSSSDIGDSLLSTLYPGSNLSSLTSSGIGTNVDLTA